jgi:RHS repeat-associated protein
MPATQHQYHFEDLSPDDFERLVYWLVERSGEFDQVQWYGGARDKGRDVVAYKHAATGREKWYVQCKRYGRITYATLREELDKLAEHAEEEPGFAPEVIVFATACPVPPRVKDRAAVRASVLDLPDPYYWTRLELDERLKAQPQTVAEFFDIAAPVYVPPTPPDPDTLPDPGPLPPGSRTSFHRNDLFTGRDGPLKALARALLHDEAPSTLVTQAVRGMGGVGKTQLAVEFAHRYGRFFHGVHWLNAAQPEALGAELAACGAAMGLPNWPERQPDQVDRTLGEWQRGGPRLVVLDNLEDVAAAHDWLGRLSGAPLRLLLTARRSDWPRDLGLNPLALDVFSPDESRAFLREYLPEERAADTDLDELAERLGHLPLALELAGRYLAHSRLSVTDYLGKLETIWDHPSMVDWREDLGSPTGHDLSLAATFAVSWQRVTDETARRLFLLAGYCAPNQPIPCELLEQAAELETEACDGALAILAGLGLLEMDDPRAGPTIHPLLAEYARHQRGAGDALPALAGALARLAGTWWADGELIGVADEDPALLVKDVLWPGEGTITATVTLTTGSAARIVFGLQDAQNYRYAEIAEGDGCRIGQVVNGEDTELAPGTGVPQAGVEYTVRVELEDGKVTLYGNDKQLASHDFGWPGALAGSVGLGVLGSQARFDDVTAATNVAAELARSYYYASSQRVAMRVSNGVTDTVYYLHGDHLGSTSLTTDEAGEVVARVLYYPYGETRWMTGTLTTDFMYTGQRAEGFGLYDYHARFYDPYLNRWIQPDTIVPDPANPQSLNRFAYVLGNPLRYVDPTGHMTEYNCADGYCRGRASGSQEPQVQAMAVDEDSEPPPPSTPQEGPGRGPVDDWKACEFQALNMGADLVAWTATLIGAMLELSSGGTAWPAYAAIGEVADKGAGAVSLYAVIRADYYAGYSYPEYDDTLYEEVPELVIGQDTTVDVLANGFNWVWSEAVGDFLVNTAEFVVQTGKFGYSTTDPAWETRITVTGVYVVYYADGNRFYNYMSSGPPSSEVVHSPSPGTYVIEPLVK